MKFRVLHSRHIANGRTFEKGDIVESSGDLVKAFPGKFERIESSVEVARVRASSPAASEAPVVPPSAPDGETSPFGEDVSEDFPSAVGADLKVFQKGSSYFVVDMDTPDKALNAKALKGAEVNKFIKAHLKA